MKHKIFIGYSQEQIEAKYPDRQIAVHVGIGVAALRDAVDSFTRFSCDKHVMLVNTRSFSVAQFTVFLKALESPDIEGSIWFYDSPLWAYEFTVRSRCEVDFLKESSYADEVKKLLTEKDANTPENLKAMKVVQAYGIRYAWLMVSRKDDFMDLLFAMEMTDNFSLFKSHMDKIDLGYVELFIEWLDHSSLFSTTQLMRAPFLRDEALHKLLIRQFPVIGLREMKKFFLLMLVHRLVGLV